MFSAIIFGGTQLGRAAASAPDFTKAKDSAARIFRLLDRVPAYADPYSKDGNKQIFIYLFTDLSLRTPGLGFQRRYSFQEFTIYISDTS